MPHPRPSLLPHSQPPTVTIIILLPHPFPLLDREAVPRRTIKR
jgi:hypothetical protein